MINIVLWDSDSDASVWKELEEERIRMLFSLATMKVKVQISWDSCRGDKKQRTTTTTKEPKKPTKKQNKTDKKANSSNRKAKNILNEWNIFIHLRN